MIDMSNVDVEFIEYIKAHKNAALPLPAQINKNDIHHFNEMWFLYV